MMKKLDLSSNEKNSKLLPNSVGKSLCHRPSTAQQDLQYEKLCKFPHSD